MLAFSSVSAHAQNRGLESLGIFDTMYPPTLLDDTPPGSGQPADQQPPGQTPGTPAPAQTTAPKPKTPEPYAENEFPDWLQRVWRAEVIFVGSLPFTYFFTLEGYDIYRWAADNFDVSSAPWPFRPGSTISYTSDEQFWLIIATLSFSGLVTAADFIIDLILASNENN
jgi:hypothetical protein